MVGMGAMVIQMVHLITKKECMTRVNVTIEDTALSDPHVTMSIPALIVSN